MRRLALPAALACLVTLALPTTVLALGLGTQDACPPGPGRVASHTDMERTLDGQAVSIFFALRQGCDDVDVSLLSYQVAAGPTAPDSAEQVLYDVATATVSAGRINRLQVAVVPDCWSLVKLVVGRPPAGASDPARMRAWDRLNTVHSKWDGGPAACSGTAPSPLEEDGLLGSLLRPPGTAATTPGGAAPPAAPDLGTARQQQGIPSGPASPDAPARGGTAADNVVPDAGTAAGGDSGGATTTPPGATATQGGDQLASAAPPDQLATDDGALPLTGTNVLDALLAGVGLVVAGTLLLRLGRRYRARHLTSYRGRHLASS